MPINVSGHPRFIRKYRNLEPTLRNKVDNILDLLKAGNKGVFIKYKPYPKIYVKDGAKNLFKYNIESYRLIYSLVGKDDSKIYQILDFLTHKEYDVLFSYHTT